MNRVRIGELLVQRGHIDVVQLESALAHQRRWGGRLGRSIVELGFMPERAMLEHLGEQMGVPVVDLAQWSVAPQALALVPERLMRTRRVLPLERRTEHRRGPLVVAVADPRDLHVLDEVAFATGLEVEPVLASETELDRALARFLDGPSRSAALPAAIDLPEDTWPVPGGRTKLPQ